MGLFNGGHITPIKPVKVFDDSFVQDAFRHMQQGQHIGKIVIGVRDIDGNVKSDITPIKPVKQLKIDKTASYMLVGGLGGLGRAVSRHLVEHNARCLVFLSRNAGSGPEDHDFIEELKSMGCDVRLVKGSVASIYDVSRAVQQATNLKGIMQCSIVLRDQAFPRMSQNGWKTATAPKVQGTWNLHNKTLSAGIDLDFFVLYPSMSGVTGQAVQANYARADTFLDSLVQYRTHMGLLAASIDIGAVGYVSQDDALLKRMKLASAHGITEPELMEAITAAILFSPSITAGSDTAGRHFVDPNTIVLGLRTAIPLSSPESRAFWRKDRRMAVYHNSSKVVSEDTGSGNDGLKSFVTKARNDASILKSGETAAFLA